MPSSGYGNGFVLPTRYTRLGPARTRNPSSGIVAASISASVSAQAPTTIAGLSADGA